MIGGRMVKIIIGTFAAALISYLLALIPGAISQAPSAIPSPAVKSDRLETAARAAACSEFAWPYYDSTCLHDSRRSGGEARKVRFVSPRAPGAD